MEVKYLITKITSKAGFLNGTYELVCDRQAEGSDVIEKQINLLASQKMYDTITKEGYYIGKEIK